MNLNPFFAPLGANWPAVRGFIRDLVWPWSGRKARSAVPAEKFPTEARCVLPAALPCGVTDPCFAGKRKTSATD